MSWNRSLPRLVVIVAAVVAAGACGSGRRTQQPAPSGGAAAPAHAAQPQPRTAAAKPPTTSAKPRRFIDPVCHKEITNTAAAPYTTVEDRIIYFCSQEHKQLFEQNPSAYLGQN
jgi:YHS domain-containing protein